MSDKRVVIAKLLMDFVGTKVYGEELPYAWPDTHFDPGPTPRYIAVDMFFNQPGVQSLDTGGLVQLMGLFQLSVVWPKGEGSIKPLTIAADVLDDWPRGKTFFDADTGTKVVIYSAPYTAGAVRDTASVRYPIIIPWQVADHA